MEYLCWPATHEHEAYPGVWLIYLMSFHWRKLFFALSQKVLIANNFLAMAGTLFPVPLPCARVLSNLSSWQSYLCWHKSLGAHTRTDPIISGKHHFLEVISHLWTLREGGCYINIPLRAKHPKVSHSLHIVPLWVFVLIITLCRKKLLWWGLSEALIYSNMLVEVIHWYVNLAE